MGQLKLAFTQFRFPRGSYRPPTRPSLTITSQTSLPNSGIVLPPNSRMSLAGERWHAANPSVTRTKRCSQGPNADYPQYDRQGRRDRDVEPLKGSAAEAEPYISPKKRLRTSSLKGNSGPLAM